MTQLFYRAQGRKGADDKAELEAKRIINFGEANVPGYRAARG